MKWLLKNPEDKEFRVIEMEHTLKNIREVIGGYMECVAPFGYEKGKVVLIINEEGKICGMPVNLTDKRGIDNLCGPVLVAEFDGKADFQSVSDAEKCIQDIKKYYQY